MAKVRQMQGVPAQLTYLKSDGIRRHPAHCIFSEGTGQNRTCTNIHSPKFNMNCKSSKQCEYYEDDRTDVQKSPN